MGLETDEQGRAFKLGILNGVLFAVVMSAIRPDMVLSAFFLKLTDSTFFATLPIALMRIGSLWPQLIVSNVVEAKERKKPFYIVAATARVTFLGMMALSTYLFGLQHPGLLITLVPILYFSYSSGSGVCGIAFMDMVGKTVPANRRGRFMGLRGFLGGILGFASGFYVRYMLGVTGPDFPANYAWLYATASIFQAGTLLAFAGIPEPINKVRDERIAFRKHLAQGLSILKQDRDYKIFFLVRLVNSLSLIGTMVFIPYAVKELGMPDSIVGVLMIISVCFGLPSNFLWSHLSDKYGNRLLLLISTGVHTLVPIVALASYYFPDYSLNFMGYDLRVLIFIIAFTLSAAAMKGRRMGYSNYMLEIAPEERRPSYLAFMSVLLAPTTLVPLMAGVIAELISFQATFTLSFVFGLVGYMSTLKLTEPRDGTNKE
jgi:MFS family permease